MKKKLLKIAAEAVVISLFAPCSVYGTEPEDVNTMQNITVTSIDGAEEEKAPQSAVSPVDAFLAKSVFVGNSVGEGLEMYNNAMGKVPLGNAVMLTRVSYSFNADERGSTRYIPKYNGVPMRAKDAIRLCGADYAFICMGTNDLTGNASAETAFNKYQQYIAGIMAENPNLVIFIESCTPTRPGSNVGNEKVNVFNSYMESYCALFPNMFYIDISTPLKDGTGFLDASYCSDGSCHLTNRAYGIWADTVRTYISGFIAARAAALARQKEADRAAANANYEKSMDAMYNKKQKTREERMEKERQVAAALEEQKRYELLNVPDEVTVMKTAVAADSKKYNDIFSVSLM